MFLVYYYLYSSGLAAVEVAASAEAKVGRGLYDEEAVAGEYLWGCVVE